ncbi:MAG: C-GCAxxG-C-C family protein [Muribaculaceae bacterium]|nr:C-GCAxxG-C-C family protein [Muribaculaceae bacterium]
MTLSERKERAMELRRQGYNCAQAVLLAFNDVTGLSEDMAARLSSGLGAGVGGSRELCGAVTGMALVESSRHGSAPADKAGAMKAVGRLTDEFKTRNGCLRCEDLKGVPGKAPCNDLILHAVEIMHNSLNKPG